MCAAAADGEVIFLSEEKMNFLARVSGFPSILCVSVFQFQGGFQVSGEGLAAHVSLGGYPDGHLGEPSGDGGRVQGPAAQVSSVGQPHKETWVVFWALPAELGSALLISIIVCDNEGEKKYMGTMFGNRARRQDCTSPHNPNMTV